MKENPQKNSAKLKMRAIQYLRRKDVVAFVRHGRFLSSLSSCGGVQEPAGDCPLQHLDETERVISTRKGTATSLFTRSVPKNKEEADRLKGKPQAYPANSHYLAVSIVGLPNAGKSTLTNALMGWRICSVSNKVHTTQHNTKAVLLQGNIQIVLLDTPGIVTLAEKRRHNLDMTMVSDPTLSVAKVDLVIVIVDVSNIWTRHQLSPHIIKLLEAHKDKVSILVLNKIDLLKSKRLLLEITSQLTKGMVAGQTFGIKKPKQDSSATSLTNLFRKTKKILEEQRWQKPESMAQPKYDIHHCITEHTNSSNADISDHDQHSNKDVEKCGWPFFQRVFMISAIDSDGIEELKEYLLETAKPNPWVHRASFVTDQSPQEIVVLAIREKLLDILPKEVPYRFQPVIHAWDVDENDVLRIVVLLKCPEKHYVKLVIGPQGQRIRQIANAARQELMNTFRSEISLKLIVEYHKSR